VLLLFLVQIFSDQIINFNGTITFNATVAVDKVISCFSFDTTGSGYELLLSVIVVDSGAHSTLGSR